MELAVILLDVILPELILCMALVATCTPSNAFSLYHCFMRLPPIASLLAPLFLNHVESCVPLCRFGQDCLPLCRFGQDCLPLCRFGQDCLPLCRFGQDCLPLCGFGQDCLPLCHFGQDCLPLCRFGQDCLPLCRFGQDCLPLCCFGSSPLYDFLGKATQKISSGKITARKNKNSPIFAWSPTPVVSTIEIKATASSSYL